MWEVRYRLDGRKWNLLGAWASLTDAREVMDRVEATIQAEMELSYVV